MAGALPGVAVLLASLGQPARGNKANSMQVTARDGCQKRKVVFEVDINLDIIGWTVV